MREWISLTHFESRRYERSASTETLAEPPIDPHPLRRAEAASETAPHPILQLLLLPFVPFLQLFEGLRRLAGFFGEIVSATLVIALLLLVALIIGVATGLIVYFAPAAAAIGLALLLNNRRK
jgi:small-conductance mechanosensitive channel